MCKTVYFLRDDEFVDEAINGTDILRITGIEPKMTDNMPIDSCLCYFDKDSLPFFTEEPEYTGADLHVHLDKPKT